MSSLQKKLIFKKFRVGRLIHKSDISLIHEGKNELTQEPVAMKFEKNKSKFELLESEAYILFLLKGLGIPRVISFGKTTNYKVLVEELLGQTIYLIWNKKINDKNKLNDICLIAIQCINRLEYIHSRNIIHRDIKPFNFVFGRKDPNLIYLIDFGISRKYRSSKSGNHIRYKKLNSINGSMRYMSINCNKGYEQSRRDDLESLGYLLIYLIKKTLPWIHIEKQNIDSKEKFLKICSIKSTIKPEELCSGLPIEFCQYIKYCRDLRFEQQPNYNYLRNLFIEVIKANEKFIDIRFIHFMQFSWLKNNNIKKINRYSKIKGQYLSIEYNNKKRGNSHSRLLNQIKESIDKAKSQEVSGYKNSNFFSFNLKNINIILNKNNNDTFTARNNRKNKNINSYNNINNNKDYKLNKIDISNFNREKTEESSIENSKLRKIFFDIPKGSILYKTILTKSDKYHKNIDNLVYSNHLKKIKILKLNNNTNKDSSTKIENKSIDNYFNFNKFHYYRTLEQREKEKELKNNSISPYLNKKNLSIEYNFKSNIFFNDKILPKKLSDSVNINKNNINDDNNKLLDNKGKTYQIKHYKKIFNN